MTEIVGEAHVLAEKSEMDHGIVEKLLEAQFGPLPTMISRRLTQGVYIPPKGQSTRYIVGAYWHTELLTLGVSPWSNLDLALKDTGHAIDCAGAVGTRLRVGEVIQDHQQRAKAYSKEHKRQLDSAALYGIIRCDAGLDFENEFVKQRDA
jgi:3-hydroxyisobutyrate dehydrogenase-like beta-hydroxyacid dehydrogenase